MGRGSTNKNCDFIFLLSDIKHMATDVDAQSITIAALSSLVRSKEIEGEVFDKAMKDLGISRDRKDITAL